MPICKDCQDDLTRVAYGLWKGPNWRYDRRVFAQTWILMTMMMRLAAGLDIEQQSQQPEYEKTPDSNAEVYATKRLVRDIFKQRHLCWCCSHIWIVYLRRNGDVNPFSDEDTLADFAQRRRNAEVTLTYPQSLNKNEGGFSQITCGVFVSQWRNLLLPIPAYRIVVRDGADKATLPGLNEENIYRFDVQNEADGSQQLVLRSGNCGDVGTLGQDPRAVAGPTTEGLDEARAIGLMKMIDECDRSHENCRSKKSTKRLPSRLLDLRGHGTHVFLVPTTDLSRSSNYRYATLSHRWGKKGFKTLRSSNYDEMLRGVPIEDLARTFRQSIAICRQVGIDFIWIDCLCIIQDSLSDWEAEAPRMYDVYSNSTLNLAATAADSSTKGMFEVKGLYDPVLIKLTDKVDLCLQEMKKDMEIDRLINYSPLLSRGWVLQELCISSRVLHVTQSTLIWHCADRIASIPSRDQESLEGFERLRLHRSLSESLDQRGLDRLWRQFIHEYSREKLTFRKDKMIAISGLAATFSDNYEKLGLQTRYCAGFWEHSLLHHLGWYPAEPPKRGFLSPATGIPSWSWLCRDDAVTVPSWLEKVDGGPRETIFTSEIIEITLQTEVPSHTFGQLSEGRIRIRGPVMHLRRRTIWSVFAETYRDFLSKFLAQTGSSYSLPIRMLAWAWNSTNWLLLFLNKLFEWSGRYKNLILTNGKGREIIYYQFDHFNRADCRFDRLPKGPIGRVFKCIILGHYMIPEKVVESPDQATLTDRQVVALLLEETETIEGVKAYRRCGQLQIAHSPYAESRERTMSDRDKFTSIEAESFFQRDQFAEEEFVLI